MKLFESLIACVILAIFTNLASEILSPSLRVYFKTNQLKEQLAMDRFLTEGFVKLCKEKKDEELKMELVQWKKMCTGLWPLDFLKINKQGEWLVETWSFNGKTTSVKFSVNEKDINESVKD